MYLRSRLPFLSMVNPDVISANILVFHPPLVAGVTTRWNIYPLPLSVYLAHDTAAEKKAIVWGRKWVATQRLVVEPSKSNRGGYFILSKIQWKEILFVFQIGIWKNKSWGHRFFDTYTHKTHTQTHAQPHKTEQTYGPNGPAGNEEGDGTRRHVVPSTPYNILQTNTI